MGATDLSAGDGVWRRAATRSWRTRLVGSPASRARALGVHVNFAPVVDVNNNARNPVINTRSFGEDPQLVGRLASAYVRGLQSAGVIATLKHFPGHGDTDVDSHLGLPVIPHPRERLDQIELPPFRAGIAAGADAVMTGAHRDAGARSDAEHADDAQRADRHGRAAQGAWLQRAHLHGLDGDAGRDRRCTRPARRRSAPSRRATTLSLHSPDDGAAFAGIQRRGEVRARFRRRELDESVRRILRAKARLGLHEKRTVNLDAVPTIVGTRAHQAVARRGQRARRSR